MRIKKIVDMYNKISIPAKAALWFTICNIIVKGISFISTPLFSHILSENEFGRLTLLMSYEQIVLVICTWEIHIGAYQKGLFKYENNIEDYSISTLALENILSLIVAIAALIVFAALKIKHNIAEYNVVLLFLYVLFYPGYYMWLIRKRTSFDYKKVILGTLLFSIANLVVPLIIVLSTEQTATIKFASSLVISIMIFFPFCAKYYYALVARKSYIKTSYIRYNLSFSAPLLFHSLSFLILNQSDRIMIGNMIGEVQAGYYGIAYTIGNVVALIPTSINQALVPWIYKSLKNGIYTSIKYTTNKILLGIGCLITFFILIAPDIIEIFFSDNYSESIWCIPPVSCSLFFTFLYTLFVNCESYYEKTKYVMVVSIPCAFMNIVLNYFGIIYFGYIACAYTTLFSYIVFALGHYCLCKKVMQTKMKNAFDIKRIVLYSLIMVTLTIAMPFVYTHKYIRYIIVLGLLICITVYRKRIIGFASKMYKERMDRA